MFTKFRHELVLYGHVTQHGNEGIAPWYDRSTSSSTDDYRWLEMIADDYRWLQMIMVYSWYGHCMAFVHWSMHRRCFFQGFFGAPGVMTSVIALNLKRYLRLISAGHSWTQARGLQRVQIQEQFPGAKQIIQIHTMSFSFIFIVQLCSNLFQ